MTYDASEWKPGDYMLARVIRWPNAREWPDDTSRVLLRLDEDRSYWNAVEGDPSDPFRVNVNTTPDYLHPLVVIDPEDAEQVNGLAQAYLDALPAGLSGTTTDLMQSALREFARPTPRIEEPTLVGATIADEHGQIWARDILRQWRCLTHDLPPASWSEFGASTRLLSPGVPS